MSDRKSLTREEARAIDAQALERFGIPSFVLMENAGRGAAEAIVASVGSRALKSARPRAAIVCGGGNNGGDGYVAARHLTLAGWEVELFSMHAAEALRGDATTAREIAERMGLTSVFVRDERELEHARQRWREADVLVDALLGTGAIGAPRPELARVIESFNAAPDVLRVALDLPSGLDCDSGDTPGACIRADMTITFVAEKRGFANRHAAALLGRVLVVGIGAPTEL